MTRINHENSNWSALPQEIQNAKHAARKHPKHIAKLEALLVKYTDLIAHETAQGNTKRADFADSCCSWIRQFIQVAKKYHKIQDYKEKYYSEVKQAAEKVQILKSGGYAAPRKLKPGMSTHIDLIKWYITGAQAYKQVIAELSKEVYLDSPKALPRCKYLLWDANRNGSQWTDFVCTWVMKFTFFEFKKNTDYPTVTKDSQWFLGLA